MIKGKIQTLKNSFAIAVQGHDFKSKKILFLTSLLNHFGHGRKGLRNRVSSMIDKLSVNNEVVVKLKAKYHLPYDVKYRLNDYSDYQSLGECLGDMYEIPPQQIDYFIDGGANLGFFSLSLLNKHSFKEAILIEPNPANLKLLEYNVARFSNITVLPYALGKNAGTVVFELASSNTGHVKGSIGHTETDNTVMVKAETLPAIIPTNWDMEKTLLKLDIEGAEYDVIDDLIHHKIFPKIIVGEVHDYLRCDGIGLVNTLKSAGYEVKVTGFGTTGNVCRQIVAMR
jgi:FkbM family methyltransferase